MSEERWVFVDEKGRLMLHTENDGETFLNRGPETVETEITLDELRASYPSLVKKPRRLFAAPASQRRTTRDPDRPRPQPKPTSGLPPTADLSSTCHRRR